MRQSHSLVQHWPPPNLQKSFSDKKKWVRYGLANPRIVMVLVIPKHNAPFRPSVHWLPVSQPRNRKACKSEYRFVFIVILYASIVVDIRSPAFLDFGFMIVRINAVQRIE